MSELSIQPDYVEMLILKVRALMVRELGNGEDSSSAIDDDMHAMLEDLPGDLSRLEVDSEIQGLSPKKQAELVALMWLGRGDGEAEDWDDLLDLAIERADAPSERYLLDHPHVADHWAEGLEKLGLGGFVDEVEML